MSRTMRDLLDEYRHAGLNRRLHLYLQYPDLRSDFTEMDRNANLAKVQDSMPKARCTSTCSLAGRKSGWAKRLFGMKPGAGAAGV